jgi:hypothetical protein
MKKYNRLFTFGCSFTNYHWPTWANILAYELNVPLYNYGLTGAGNQYIFNMLMQADGFYNFTNDDLITICWTNVSREDRYKNDNWVCSGNIYTQQKINKDFVDQWADSVFYALRDFASIKASIEFLNKKNCDYFMFKMADFSFVDQWSNISVPKKYNDLLEFYNPYLSQVHKSFYEVLWKNDISNKWRQERLIVGAHYQDGHPLVSEHLEYLQNVLSYNFSEATIELVKKTNDKIINKLKDGKSLDGRFKFWEIDYTDTFFNHSEKVLQF